MFVPIILGYIEKDLWCLFLPYTYNIIFLMTKFDIYQLIKNRNPAIIIL